MALSCHMALDMLCQEMRPGSGAVDAESSFVTARKAFLSSWTGCDKNERGVETMKEEGAAPESSTAEAASRLEGWPVHRRRTAVSF